MNFAKSNRNKIGSFCIAFSLSVCLILNNTNKVKNEQIEITLNYLTYL